MTKFQIGDRVRIRDNTEDYDLWQEYGEYARVTGFVQDKFPVVVQFEAEPTKGAGWCFAYDELEHITELKMDCPAERETKLVLVTINWTNGKTSWRLARATKVGRFYNIDETALTDMQRDYWQGWPPRTDTETWNSLHTRPASTYREFKASNTISDTGPQRVR
jgi:hypothetical protein